MGKTSSDVLVGQPAADRRTPSLSSMRSRKIWESFMRTRTLNSVVCAVAA